jgi:hypothetical protein
MTIDISTICRAQQNMYINNLYNKYIDISIMIKTLDIALYNPQKQHLLSFR